MTDEVVSAEVSGGLVIAEDQVAWNEAQVAQLRQIGLEDASGADLAVFFHHCRRTGLDPFARQIYMIPREMDARVRVELPNGGSRVESRRITKFTIQTGIDGYRLIGRRAARRDAVLVSHDAPQWLGADREWLDYWAESTPPVAARYTIRVDGAPFTATCMFDEFAQFSGRGELTSMWRKMPANQLAKCAESAAWRKAFPADFSGIDTEASAVVIDSAGARVRGGSAPIREEDIMAPRARPTGRQVESAVVDDIRDDELTRAAEQADVDVLDAARDAEIAAGAITAGQVAALSELLVARFPNKTPKDAAARRARHDFIAAQTGCRVDKLEDLTVGQADAVIAVLSD